VSDDVTKEDPAPDMEFDAAALAGTDALAQARAETQALKEQVLRFAAEAENTRRRAEREANDARAYAIQKFATDVLGVADNLARALAAQPADTGDVQVKNFVIGVEMTEKELLSAFERNGLKRIAPKPGDRFDPHLHQAMAEQPGSGLAAGSVVQALQPGYELLGRLVRPAMVVVAAKEAPPPNPYAPGEDDASGGAVDTRA
jgi:molecular chaperone GrpE